MELAGLLRADAPIKVHHDRTAQWDVELDDEDLKAAMFSTPRMLGRIVTELSGGTILIDKISEDVEALAKRLSKNVTQEQLHDIGLGWCAPRLFLCLFNKETRFACGPLTASQIEILKEFRSHSNPNLIPTLPHEDEVIDYGRMCVVAWLLEQNSPAADALLLCLSPEEEAGVTTTNARAQYFDLFLNYTEERGE